MKHLRIIGDKSAWRILVITTAVFVIANCAPIVKKFTPEIGSVGTEVTIEGENFKDSPDDNTVKFGGVQVPTADIVSNSSEIKAKVPVGAQTGIISVTTSDGTGESDKNFQVDSAGSQAEWTFMVFIDADNNLETAGLEDFLEMAAVGSTPGVNIIVQMDRHPSSTLPNFSGAYGNWAGTRRFVIQSGDDPSVTPTVDLGEKNMGDPAVLQDFVEWAISNYPAKHYALSIWNHGDGWRLLQRQLIERAERAMGAGEPDTAVIRAVCSDDTDGDVLYMREVQDALQNAKRNLDRRNNTYVKLDIVGFDACLMGMVEVAYALRNVANIVVGSEDFEPGDGWPYDKILGKLATTPTKSPEDLADIIVNEYVASYGSSPGITQSALNVNNIGALVASIDAFALAVNSDWNNIKMARNDSEVFHSPLYCPQGCWGTDLWDFADEVYSKTSSFPIKFVAQALKDSIDNAIISEAHNPASADIHGVAIYFPPNISAFNNDPDHAAYMDGNQFMPVDFVKFHLWDNWLQKYYSNIP